MGIFSFRAYSRVSGRSIFWTMLVATYKVPYKKIRMKYVCSKNHRESSRIKTEHDAESQANSGSDYWKQFCLWILIVIVRDFATIFINQWASSICSALVKFYRTIREVWLASNMHALHILSHIISEKQNNSPRKWKTYKRVLIQVTALVPAECVFVLRGHNLT